MIKTLIEKLKAFFCRHEWDVKIRYFDEPKTDDKGRLSTKMLIRICSKCGKMEYFAMKNAYEQLQKNFVSGSLPSDDRIVAEAIQVVRKVDTEVDLLPSNNDIKMFCLGAKWMRDLAQSNDH